MYICILYIAAPSCLLRVDFLVLFQVYYICGGSDGGGPHTTAATAVFVTVRCVRTP